MQLEAAIRAAAPDAPAAAISGMLSCKADLKRLGALENERRVAHLIGQCAHESQHFRRLSENLFYTTASRIRAVWPSRFRTEAAAEPFTRNPEKLAEKVYGGRRDLGNDQPGDGFRFRGRGYLQLTGRANYREFGGLIGVDLLADPEKAAEPETAWLLAACYMATRKLQRRSVFEWADRNDLEKVTKAINGGLNGLDDRRALTERAFAGISSTAGSEDPELAPAPPLDLARGARGVRVTLLQRALIARGIDPGPLDGIFGSGTEKAVRAFQKLRGLEATGIASEALFRLLNETLELAEAESDRQVQVPRAPQTPRFPVSRPAVGFAEETQELAPLASPVPPERQTDLPDGATAQPGLPMLALGASGMPVSMLHLCLAQSGFAVALQFDDATLKSVKAFQKARKLTVDGIVGPETWGALLNSQGDG